MLSTCNTNERSGKKTNVICAKGLAIMRKQVQNFECKFERHKSFRMERQQTQRFFYLFFIVPTAGGLVTPVQSELSEFNDTDEIILLLICIIST